MTSNPNPSPSVVDYWREVAQRGVEAVGFVNQTFAGEAWMAAELTRVPAGMVGRAALATLELDKQIAADAGSLAWRLRRALADRLGSAAAIGELAAYQAVLVERLHAEIKADPAQALARLSFPHESALRLGG